MKKKELEISEEEIIPTAELKEENTETETISVIVEPDIPPVVTGVVVNCQMLNVRIKPDATSRIIGVIPALADVELLADEDAHPEFYKIKTETIVKGYCIKKYIALRQ